MDSWMNKEERDLVYYDIFCHQVHVDKGMKDGDKVTFRGESTQVCII